MMNDPSPGPATITAPEQLGRAWLAAALGARPEDLGELRHQRLGNERSHLGSVVRVNLDPLRPDLPGSVIVKFVSPTAARLVRAWKLGRREIAFYRELAGTTTLRVPACHRAVFDEERSDYTLVLEDLGTAPNTSQTLGRASFADAQRALEELGRFHAQLWRSPILAAAAWLPTPSSEHWAPEVVVRDAWRACARRYPHLPTSRPSALAALEARHGGALDRLSREPTTLVHGDYRLDNLSFGERFGVIDWQLSGRARGAWDAATFIAGCLTTEERAAYAMELLRVYHRSLGTRAAEVPFEECVRDYHAAVVGSFSQIALIVAQLLETRGYLTAAMEVTLQRVAATVADSLGAPSGF